MLIYVIYTIAKVGNFFIFGVTCQRTFKANNLMWMCCGFLQPTILIKIGSALVDLFLIESNSWLFESCQITELSIQIPRNFLWEDMESDSKHSIAKLMSVRTHKIFPQGHMHPYASTLRCTWGCVLIVLTSPASFSKMRRPNKGRE